MFRTARTINLRGTQLELNNASGTETIAGPAAGVTVSGGGRSRVFRVDRGVTATLSGMKISGGSAAGNGGGLLNDGGTATLAGCTISGNCLSGRTAVINAAGRAGITAAANGIAGSYVVSATAPAPMAGAPALGVLALHDRVVQGQGSATSS